MGLVGISYRRRIIFYSIRISQSGDGINGIDGAVCGKKYFCSIFYHLKNEGEKVGFCLPRDTLGTAS